jgi:hypothetical protein
MPDGQSADVAGQPRQPRRSTFRVAALTEQRVHTIGEQTGDHGDLRRGH